MNHPHKLLKLFITDDYDPNKSMHERIIMQEVVDLKKACEQLSQVGIKISRDLLYTCWRTPYRNNTRSWWVNPIYQEQLLSNCPVDLRHALKMAFERHAVHININPYKS